MERSEDEVAGSGCSCPTIRCQVDLAVKPRQMRVYSTPMNPIPLTPTVGSDTVSLASGALVPMPTLPSPRNPKRSTPQRLSRSGWRRRMTPFGLERRSHCPSQPYSLIQYSLAGSVQAQLFKRRGKPVGQTE